MWGFFFLLFVCAGILSWRLMLITWKPFARKFWQITVDEKVYTINVLGNKVKVSKKVYDDIIRESAKERTS
jgi:hypothetical protein